MSDINEQFSIDWLVGKPRPKRAEQPEDIGSSALNEAFFLYSRPIINTLNGAQDRQMRMHDLVKSVNNEIRVQSFDEFRAVINRLLEREVVEISDRDPLTGDDLVKLRT